jgi:energy-coupling factor transporter transmembrane protein EcfT
MFFGILIIIFFLSTSREKDIIVSLKTLKLPHGFSYAIGFALRSIGLALIDLYYVKQNVQEPYHSVNCHLFRE